MPRLFTGLEFPSIIAQRLAIMRGGLPGARWIEPSDFHVTLRFIGDIDPRLADDIADLLTSIHRRAFSLRLTGLDWFGKEKPHSLYAAVAPSSELSELQAEQERLMRRLGLAPEPRKFTPHVTLARLRDTRPWQVSEWIATRSPLALPAFDIGRFVLFSSRASVGGGPYLVEETYPLIAA
ncbi:MAG: RNA 2',3'-cyclic phosphodiesterase [Hyphomicrobiales bacterium]|nr:RNA 2',3'-cyclic phosphodiesterase [Hyphomicrobiales bacterium]OQW85394.1 MAG: 2'-5' RNA ligase [Proteobacteria bacterium ST_bin15]